MLKLLDFFIKKKKINTIQSERRKDFDLYNIENIYKTTIIDLFFPNKFTINQNRYLTQPLRFYIVNSELHNPESVMNVDFKSGFCLDIKFSTGHEEFTAKYITIGSDQNLIQNFFGNTKLFVKHLMDRGSKTVSYITGNSEVTAGLKIDNSRVQIDSGQIILEVDIESYGRRISAYCLPSLELSSRILETFDQGDRRGASNNNKIDGEILLNNIDVDYGVRLFDNIDEFLGIHYRIIPFYKFINHLSLQDLRLIIQNHLLPKIRLRGLLKLLYLRHEVKRDDLVKKVLYKTRFNNSKLISVMPFLAREEWGFIKKRTNFLDLENFEEYNLKILTGIYSAYKNRKLAISGEFAELYEKNLGEIIEDFYSKEIDRLNKQDYPFNLLFELGANNQRIVIFNVKTQTAAKALIGLSNLRERISKLYIKRRRESFIEDYHYYLREYETGKISGNEIVEAKKKIEQAVKKFKRYNL